MSSEPATTPSGHPPALIRGHGIDIIAVGRIARMVSEHAARFLATTYTPDELLLILGPDHAALVASHAAGGAGVPLPPVSPRCIRRLASRFAAKEATFKALGTGLASGMTWHDASVLSLPSGQPILVVRGTAASHAAKLQIRTWHLSLTDTDEWAMASVIAEG